MEIRSLFRRVVGVVSVFALAAAAACGGDAKPGDGKTPADAPKDAPKGAPADDRASWPKVLKMSCIPDADPTKLKDIHEAYAKYLSGKLGIECQFTPVTEYSSTVTGMVTKQLDLVWYGGVTSVMALKETKGNAERLVMREEDKHFRSVFIAGKSTGITKLEDLKGRTFTFGATMSTSGHFMPRYFMMKAGIDPAKDLKSAGHAKNHDETARAVEGGTVDAGALNWKTWEKLVKEKKVDTAKCDVFFTSDEYVDYCWVARKDLPAGLRTAITKALLDLDPAKPEEKKILDAHSASKYVPSLPDSAWTQVEEAGKATGLVKD